jgi:hypothetical protein
MHAALVVALVLAPTCAWPQGTPLGPEFRINTYTTNNQIRPSVASDASGNFVVVWDSYPQDGPTQNVFGQRYDSSGAPLGPEFRVNTYTPAHQYAASVAADTSGSFVVVWVSDQPADPDRGVFGQRYDSSGTPLGPEFSVNTYTTSMQGFPSVAADSSGNFVVVWESYAQDGSNWGVFGQRYVSSGTPLGPEFRVNTYTTGAQGGYYGQPAVAADSSGNFVVVWASLGQDGGGYGVFGQRYANSGNPLGPEFRVNTYTTGYQRRPSVAADSSGSFVVVWTSYTQDGPSGVFGQRYANSGNPLGPEFRVNTYTTGYEHRPSVAADPAGNFVVVWESDQPADPDGGVFGQRYDSSGNPLGPEFRVNTYTTSVQVRSSVAADSSGNFVVVWESYAQDGSHWGVFGQRYSEIVPVELMRFAVE